MQWHQKALKKYSKEMISGAVIAIVFSLILLLWVFMTGKTFTWTPIEPIDPPSILQKYFYSAFTFFTLGALLYALYFYKALKIIIVDIFGSWALYNLIKAVVWLGLMYVSFQYLVPFTVDAMNHVLSFFFNMFNLFLYIFPSAGIVIILYILYKFYLKNTASEMLKN